MQVRKATLVTGLMLAVTAFSATTALAKAGSTDRPVKGTAVGEVTVTRSLQITAHQSGVLTHLGKYTGHFEGSAEIVGGSTLGEGTFTVVAANGDQLTGTFTLNGALLQGADFTVILTVAGGTGRFADASGTVTVPLLATPSCLLEPSCPGALVETFTGRASGLISY